jgi:hypothetical protein
LAREQTGEWAGRAAKLIDAADLCHHFERYDAAPPELESGS